MIANHTNRNTYKIAAGWLLCVVSATWLATHSPMLVAAQVGDAPEGGEAANVWSLVEPYVDQHTMALLHIDLQQFDDGRWAEAVLASIRAAESPQATEEFAVGIIQRADEVLRELHDVGAKHVAVLFSAATIADPFRIVLTVDEAGQLQRAAEVLKQGAGELARGLEEMEIRDNVAVYRMETGWRQPYQIHPTDRPDIRSAIQATQGAAARLLFVPSADHRRAATQTFPFVPGAPPETEQLISAAEWAALTIRMKPELALRAKLKGSDQATARRWAEFLNQLALSIQDDPGTRIWIPAFDANLFRVDAVNSNAMLEISTAEAFDHFTRVWLEPVGLLRLRVSQVDSANRLRQVAIAIHNYHDAHGHLPPSASRGEDGQPLLSWRVLLLPFLGEMELYREFRLDEPWDSDHNSRLIERIPEIYASPDVVDLARDGRTHFAMPLGEGTVAAADEPMRLQDVPDGTSRTIMLVELSPEHSVVWTKPNDHIFSSEDPVAPLHVFEDNTINVSFFDGSVMRMRAEVPAEAFWAMLQAASGIGVDTRQFSPSRDP